MGDNPATESLAIEYAESNSDNSNATRKSDDSEKSNRGWDAATEFLVYRWRRNVEELSLEHHARARFFFFMNSFLKIPTLILSTVAGSIGLIELTVESDGHLSSDNSSSSAVESYAYRQSQIAHISGAMSLAVAVLTALHNAFHLDLRAENHLLASKNYAKLAVGIDVCLVRRREKRENASAFIDRLVWSVQTQVDNSPPVSRSVVPVLFNSESSQPVEFL